MNIPLILFSFIIISAGFLWYSWKPLHDLHAHGFYRFFAFEIILLLILLNLKGWFADPFSNFQMISWVLPVISISLAVHGFYLLHKTGRPEGSFEDTTVLVTRGAYRYIRHPLYCSLIYLVWAVFLKDPSIPGACLAIVATIFLYATAKVEEMENMKHFGDDYEVYRKKTRMFIPFIF